MAFLTGFERVPGQGSGAYEVGKWKLVLHTTEGHNVAGALSAYRDHGGWPHFTVSFEEKKRLQHVDTAVSARALRAGLGPIRTNKAHAIQVEIVGFAKDTMSQEKAEWIGREVVAPIRAAHPEIGLHGPRFFGQHEGIVLAQRSSPIRFKEQAWYDFDGICGHQHAPPKNDHWDPGRIPFDTIVAAARGGASPKRRKELLEMMMVQSEDTGAVLLVTGGVSFLIESPAEAAAHKQAGIPQITVAHTQFKRYESVRKA